MSRPELEPEVGQEQPRDIHATYRLYFVERKDNLLFAVKDLSANLCVYRVTEGGGWIGGGTLGAGGDDTAVAKHRWVLGVRVTAPAILDVDARSVSHMLKVRGEECSKTMHSELFATSGSQFRRG